MNFRHTIICLAAFCLCVSASAQDPRYEYSLRMNPQLEKAGAAALADFDSKNMSFADFSFGKDNGGFVGIDGSNDCMAGTLSAESYTRISDRIVFFGGLSYSYFTGKNMAGSLLRDMYYNPVAFLEPTSEFAGQKTGELYSMSGGLSYSLSKALSAGLRMDYQSGNKVKVKDPRYRSEWMYLNLDASVWFRPSSGFAVGASGIFRSTSEKIMSHIYGLADKQYKLAIDRGGFFGTNEAVEGIYGIINQSEFQPMNNIFFGGALHLSAGGYFTSLQALSRGGKYGHGTSSKPVYFEYGGLEVSWTNSLKVGGGDSSSHVLSLDADFKSISNKENTIKYSTAAGSNTVVNYVGQKEVLTRTTAAASLGYKGSTGVVEGSPALSFGASVDADFRTQRATIFPYYRDHNRTAVSARAFAVKNIYSSKSIISFGGDLFGGAGFGVAASDGILATATGGNVVKYDDLLNRQFEYETAPYAGACLKASYTRHLSNKVSAYVSVSDDFRSLIKAPEYLGGRFRNCALISVGLTL